MPELGRPAASEGNAYHDVTTALRIVEMIRNGDIEYVWPEAVAPVDDIHVAFADGRDRFEQVKERSPGLSWTVAALFSEGIFGQFYRQLAQDPGSGLVLVTGSDASDLLDLTERARSALENASGDERRAAVEWRARLGAKLGAVADDVRDRLLGDDEGQCMTQWRVAGVADVHIHGCSHATRGLPCPVSRNARPFGGLPRTPGV
jgi:hypothetical protein